MSKHSEIGLKGEVFAQDFLLKKGYTILFTNWRTGRKEVDIIAYKDGLVIMAEVKTRSGINFGFPEEAVDRKKQQFLKIAGTAFLEAFPQYKNLRYDIISVVMNGDALKEIIHFEEAFY